MIFFQGDEWFPRAPERRVFPKQGAEIIHLHILHLHILCLQILHLQISHLHILHLHILHLHILRLPILHLHIFHIQILRLHILCLQILHLQILRLQILHSLFWLSLSLSYAQNRTLCLGTRLRPTPAAAQSHFLMSFLLAKCRIMLGNPLVALSRQSIITFLRFLYQNVLLCLGTRFGTNKNHNFSSVFHDRTSFRAQLSHFRDRSWPPPRLKGE